MGDTDLKARGFNSALDVKSMLESMALDDSNCTRRLRVLAGVG